LKGKKHFTHLAVISTVNSTTDHYYILQSFGDLENYSFSKYERQEPKKFLKDSFM